MRLTIKMDVAAKYATQWVIFLSFGKIQRETNVAAKFELCMTLLRRDIHVLLKTAFFGICESVTLFLNTLTRSFVPYGKFMWPSLIELVSHAAQFPNLFLFFY